MAKISVTYFMDGPLVKLTRAHDLVSRVHEFVNRVHEFISRVHELVSREHDIKYFTNISLYGSVYIAVR